MTIYIDTRPISPTCTYRKTCHEFLRDHNFTIFDGIGRYFKVDTVNKVVVTTDKCVDDKFVNSRLSWDLLEKLLNTK